MNSWILLRGLSRESGHWGHFLDDFKGRHAGDAVTALDIAGNGDYWTRESATTIEEMVTQLRCDAERRNLPVPANLIGISMGAMVAAHWAATRPDEVNSAVLINTSMRPFSKFYQRLRPANYLSLAALACPCTNAMMRERIILALTSATRPERVVQEWVHINNARPVSTANLLRQLLAAARFCAPSVPPAVPLLILSSRNDQLVDHVCSIALANRWNAELRVHSWAGHDIPLDDPKWVIDQIATWRAHEVRFRAN